MGDRARREDLCYYCCCPCIEPEYSFKKYLKYLLPLLILLLIVFYPLGDPKEFCGKETDCSSGTFKRIICSSYRFLGRMEIPELPKLNSILEAPALQRLELMKTRSNPCKEPTNQPPIERPSLPLEDPSDYLSDYPPDNSSDDSPDNIPEHKGKHMCMFPGCTSGYRCRIRRSFFGR